MNLIGRRISLACAMLFPSVTFGASPVPYNDWQLNADGTIDSSASCSQPGVSCKVFASDIGFLEEEIRINGDVYHRVIMAEVDPHFDLGKIKNNNQLAYTEESYIALASTGGPTQGIAAHSKMRDRNSNYVDTTEIQRGYAKLNEAGTPDNMFNISLDQAINDPDFVRSFNYLNYTEVGSSAEIGERINLQQAIPMDTGGRVLPTNIGTKALFDLRARRGYAGIMDNSLGTCAANPTLCQPITVTGGVTLGGSTLAWLEGDDLQSLFMADNVNGPVAYQALEHLGTAARVDEFSMYLYGLSEPVNPFDWDAATFSDPANPTPVFP